MNALQYQWLNVREEEGIKESKLGDLRYILCMPFQHLNTQFSLVVPNPHRMIIRSTRQVGLIWTRVIINTIHPLLMALQREICLRGPQRPHLHCVIQRRTRKGVVVLRVYC